MKYKLGRLIGKGAFSSVYKCKDELTREWFAIKKIPINADENVMKLLYSELNIVRELKHPNILEFHSIFRSSHHFYIVSDLCDSPLNAMMKQITEEDDILYVIYNIIMGMLYLKSKNIIHRDIKPENILLKGKNGKPSGYNIQDYDIKIADFGMSKIQQENEVCHTICGSPLYMSPEILLHQPYTEKTDLWSIGVILYNIIYKKHPLGDPKSIPEMIHLISNGYEIPYPNMGYSKDLINIVKSLLSYNPMNRIEYDKLMNDIEFMLPNNDLSKSEPDIIIQNDLLSVGNTSIIIKREYFSPILDGTTCTFGGRTINDNYFSV